VQSSLLCSDGNCTLVQVRALRPGCGAARTKFEVSEPGPAAGKGGRCSWLFRRFSACYAPALLMIGRMRSAIWIICAVGVAAFFAIPNLCAGDQTSDAEAILNKAWDLVDISAAGSGPFLLKAKVRLTEGNKSADGVFAMAWAAPDRFRRVVGFPDYKETDVSRGENYYSKRTTDGVPLMIWKLGELMDSLGTRERMPAGEKVKRAVTQTVGGKEATCVSIGPGKGDLRICINAATGEVISIEKGLDGPPEREERLEYSDYQEIGAKKYPRHFVYSGWSKRSIAVTIDTLSAVREFAADEFSPPAGSQISRTCNGAEQMTGTVMPMFGNSKPVGFYQQDFYIYFEISPVGAVRSAQMIYNSDPKTDSEILGMYVGGKFPVKTCDGRPIGYQTLYHHFPEQYRSPVQLGGPG
jgi:hypothetical protein